MLDFVQKNLISHKEFMQDKHVKITKNKTYKYKNLLSAKLGLQ